MDESKEKNIEEIIKRLPAGYEEACYTKKAIERKREIKNPIELMRLALLYLIGEYSLIEMSIIAWEKGIAKINDTGFMKKFGKCAEWFKWIIGEIKPRAVIEYKAPRGLEEYAIMALDASQVKEKGRSGRVYTLHYAIELLKMSAATYKITTDKIGESLINFNIGKNWLVLADRAYGSLVSIEHCLKSCANFILRLKYGAFKLYNEDGSELDLLEKLRSATSDVAVDIEVYVKLAKLKFTKLRICATKIPDDKAEKVERKFKRNDSKRQRKTSNQALFMSQYVVLITALPYSISADDIVALYRLRWQVEIYFKRLKSIIDFGNVPLRRQDNVIAWLNGKLMISLFIEQMISEVSFSP